MVFASGFPETDRVDDPRDDYPFVIRRAGDPGFIRHAQELIRQNAGKFRPNVEDAERRKYWKLAGDYDPRLKAMKLALVEKFAIRDWILDPTFLDIIGHISEGGFVHPHVDDQCGTRMHMRINLLVQAPQAGCIPLLDGIPIRIAQGDAWLNLASHCRHATTPVIGATPRSIVSYGLQVEHVEAFGLYARYLTWKAAHAGAG